jgi:cell division topological specificity factor
VIEFFRSLFRPERSSTTAKERLRLVLLSDHLSLAPDVIEALKAELFAVISRYVEIDAKNADVSFEHREHDVAMTANIPILQLRPDRPAPPPPAPREAELAPEIVAQPVAVEAIEPEATAPVPTPRRRRRRKPAQAPQVSQPQVS